MASQDAVTMQGPAIQSPAIARRTTAPSTTSVVSVRSASYWNNIMSLAFAGGTSTAPSREEVSSRPSTALSSRSGTPSRSASITRQPSPTEKSAAKAPSSALFTRPTLSGIRTKSSRLPWKKSAKGRVTLTPISEPNPSVFEPLWEEEAEAPITVTQSTSSTERMISVWRNGVEVRIPQDVLEQFEAAPAPDIRSEKSFSRNQRPDVKLQIPVRSHRRRYQYRSNSLSSTSSRSSDDFTSSARRAAKDQIPHGSPSPDGTPSLERSISPVGSPVSAINSTHSRSTSDGSYAPATPRDSSSLHRIPFIAEEWGNFDPHSQGVFESKAPSIAPGQMLDSFDVDPKSDAAADELIDFLNSYRPPVQAPPPPVPMRSQRRRVGPDMRSRARYMGNRLSATHLSMAVTNAPSVHVSTDAACAVVQSLLDNAENLDDLFALAQTNKGFYHVFKQSELSSMQKVYRRQSEAAWELREASPGVVVTSLEKPSQEYTPRRYYSSIKRDSYIVTTLKSLILIRCRSFLRQQTVEALRHRDSPENARIDSALWRIWTFCTIFGSEKAQESALESQMDWLRGGEQTRQASSSSAPSFGLGNHDGLSADELYDMTEMWNCLKSLVEGIQGNGRTEQARRHGVFSGHDVPRGDVAREEQVLEQWVAYLMTLGLSAILDLATPSNSPTASIFNIALHMNWTSWPKPTNELVAARTSFLTKAVSGVYEERIHREYSHLAPLQELSENTPMPSSIQPSRSASPVATRSLRTAASASHLRGRSESPRGTSKKGHHHILRSKHSFSQLRPSRYQDGSVMSGGSSAYMSASASAASSREPSLHR